MLQKLTVLCVVLALAGSASAWTWNGEGSDNLWTNADNWVETGYPCDTTSDVKIGTGKPQYPLINAAMGTIEWKKVMMADTSTPGTAYLTMTGGTVSHRQGMLIAKNNVAGCVAVFNLSGGLVQKNDYQTGTITVGSGTLSDGTLNMSGGTIDQTSQGQASDIIVANTVSSTGVINMTDASALITVKNLIIKGYGTVNVGPGTITGNKLQFNAGSNGQVNITTGQPRLVIIKVQPASLT